MCNIFVHFYQLSNNKSSNNSTQKKKVKPYGHKNLLTYFCFRKFSEFNFKLSVVRNIILG